MSQILTCEKNKKHQLIRMRINDIVITILILELQHSLLVLNSKVKATESYVSKKGE